MRKIDLSDYTIDMPTGEGMKPYPYSVKQSIELAMYHPDLKLNFKDLLENDRVAQKIKHANGFILLEESEYLRIKVAFENIQGFRREDVELVKRVMDAPEVEVTEK
jgi:hypothetical protein